MEKIINIAQAKELDIVEYLASINISHNKIRGNDYWYLSPLHEEKTPSFKVNIRLNRWYDHALGKGGNMVDLGIALHQCSISDFLKMLNGNQPGFVTIPAARIKHTSLAEEENQIEILNAVPLHSRALIQYLESRGIPLSTAQQHTSEVTYEFKGRSYYAVGFKNNEGGYELRSPNFKLSSSPKSFTTVEHGAKNLVVFEGFMDYLSYQSFPEKPFAQPTDFLILNSTSFFNSVTDLFQRYDAVLSYFDNDPTGQKCSTKLSELHPAHHPQASTYAGHNDLNEWLRDQRQRQSYRQGPKL